MNDEKSKLNEISDRYQILEELGKGGMGIVYKAHDSFLDINVAIKILKGELSDSEAVSFQNEAKTQGKLKHSNIAEVLDFGQLKSTGSMYLVMEYVSSQTLQNYLKKNGPLEPELAIDVFVQILEAIKHAHNHNIIHRDIKPSNVLVRKDETEKLICKVVDFGIAKRMDQEVTGSSEAIVGSPYYMSPEQIDGLDVDERSDVYAIGCLFYKALTGNVPYKGKTQIDTFHLHKTGSYPKLPDNFSETRYGKQFEDIIETCLNKSPGERYQSVADILSEIKKLRSLKNEQDKQFDIDEKPATSEQIRVSFLFSPAVKNKLKPVMLLVAVIGCIALGATILLNVQYKKIEDKRTVKKKFSDFRKKHKEKSEFRLDGFEKEGTSFHIVKRSKVLWNFNLSSETTDQDLIKLSNSKNLCHNIWICSSRITGSGFEYFRNRKIFSLNIMRSPIDDKGFQEISKMSSLQKLRMHYGNSITNDGFAAITNLKELRVLSLTCKNIDDTGLDSIFKLKKLINLAIYDMPNISDKGLSKILKLKNLKALNLGGTGITKFSLNKIKKLRHLFYLNISNLDLSDKTMEAVSGIRVRKLVLNGNPRITDKGIFLLKKNKNLRYLYIKQCDLISNQGIRLLKSNLPGCQILKAEPLEITNIQFDGITSVIPKFIEGKDVESLFNH